MKKIFQGYYDVYAYDQVISTHSDIGSIAPVFHWAQSHRNVIHFLFYFLQLIVFLNKIYGRFNKINLIGFFWN